VVQVIPLVKMHNYFYIVGDVSNMVLDASMTNHGEVVLWTKNGQDNQLWFWDDGDVLKNKQFPDLALDFHWADFCDSGWGKIYLGEPTGNWNQRWEINGKELICKGSNEEPIDDLRMDVFENGTEDGTKVGVYRQNGQSNQHWNLLGHYFHILGAESGKVLDASMTNIGEVVMWEMNGQDNQLWFWDPEYREVLRNKQFPDMALDFHWADYCESDPNWGKVYLNEFTDLPNQKFEQYGSEIICKGSNEEHIPDLRLDVFQNGTDDGAKVGVYLKNDSPNQMWTLHDIK